MVFFTRGKRGPVVGKLVRVSVAFATGNIDGGQEHLISQTNHVIRVDAHGEPIVDAHRHAARLGDATCCIRSLDIVGRCTTRAYQDGCAHTDRISAGRPAEAVRTSGRRFRRQDGSASNTNQHVVTDGDGGRLRVSQVEFTRVAAPRLVTDFQGVGSSLEVVEDQQPTAIRLLLEHTARVAQLDVPRPLGSGLVDVNLNAAVRDEASGVTEIRGVLKARNDEHGIRGGAVLQPNGLHEDHVLRRRAVKGVHGRLGTVRVGQVVRRFPTPGEATRILATTGTPTDFRVRAGTTAHAAIRGQEHRETPIRVGGHHRRLRVITGEVHQLRRIDVRTIKHLNVVEEILDLSIVEQDAHHGTVPRIVRAVRPRGVLVVVVAVSRGALVTSARRSAPAHKGALQLDRIPTEDLVGACRDAVLRAFHHLDAEGRVKRAAEVVGHREGVVIDARLVQDDVAVVRVKVLIDDARTGPEAAVRVESNGRREGGHAGNQRRVEVEAPFENVPVVDGEVVHHREGPRAVQWASDKVAQVAFRRIDARIGDVVALPIARVVGVGDVGPVCVVVDVGRDVRIGTPAVIVTGSRDVGPVVHRLTEETTTTPVGVAHQGNGCPIGAGDRQVEVSHVAVLHVDGHRQEIVAIVQRCTILEEVKVEFAGVAETRTVREVGLPCDDLWRQGRPRHALHRIAIHEGRTSRTHWRALETVEQRNRAHQHLQRLEVQGDTTIVVDDRQVDDVLARLVKAVGHVGAAVERVDRAVVKIPDPVLEVEAGFGERSGIAKRDGGIQAHPDGQRVGVRQRRIDDGAGRGRRRTRGGAADIGFPTRRQIVGRTIVLEHKRETARGVVDRGRDRQALQGIARVVAHGRGAGIRSVVDEQVVAVVWVRIGLETKGHEAHRNGIAGVVRANRVGEVFIRVGVSGSVIRVARIDKNAGTGFDGLVAHDEELRLNRSRSCKQEQDGASTEDLVSDHAHGKLQRWNPTGIPFVAFGGNIPREIVGRTRG